MSSAQGGWEAFCIKDNDSHMYFAEGFTRIVWECWSIVLLIIKTENGPIMAYVAFQLKTLSACLPCAGGQGNTMCGVAVKERP